MIVYTGDLISIAQKFAERIDADRSNPYIAEDVCCDLQLEIRNILYERLGDAFSDLIKKANSPDIEINLGDELFKIISEL